MITRMFLLPPTLAIMQAGCMWNEDGRSKSPRPTLIVAHRGASGHAPENTMAAFELGFDRNADAVEGDFRLTRDGVIVAMHDVDLQRTTGDPRRVDEIRFAELQRLDAGAWGPWREAGFAGARVPSLEMILDAIPEGRGVFIEVKDPPHIVPALIDVVDRSGIDVEMVTVISFDAAVIESLKANRPEWRALWLTGFKRRDDGWSPDVESLIETARRIGADGVDVQASLEVIDESFVSSVREAGLEFHVWTVDDPEVARALIRFGVDSITTNHPGSIQESLRKSMQESIR